MIRLAFSAAILATLGAAPAAWAQAAPPGAETDSGAIVTLQAENDAVSTLKGTSDQYYTSGLRLGYVSGVNEIGLANDIGAAIWGAGTSRLSIDLSQAIYTPRNTQISPPNPQDRPYAGVLLASFGVVHDTATTRDQLALGLGVAGPAALGRQVQNGFHSLISDPDNKGWRYQVPDQPAISIAASRIWRLPLGDVFGLQTDALPSAGGTLGDVRIALQGGALLRIGEGLESDFGPTRIAAGPAGAAMNGGDAFVTVAPVSWSLFAGVDGQAVAYDYAIDGAAFRTNSPRAHRVWDQGGMIAGASILWHGVRITYTQDWRTQETAHAKAGLFNFGSLSAAVRF